MGLVQGGIRGLWAVLLLSMATFSYADTVRPKPRTETDNLTGDWHGTRTSLAEQGIKPSGFFAATAQQNIKGGLERGNGSTSLLNAGVLFDLATLFGIEGASLNVSASWANGSNLSSARIGNDINVSTVFSGQSLRFYELWWDQKWLGERLDIKLGRVSPANDFGILPVYADYVTSGINGNIATLLYNDGNFTSDPVAQWGSTVTLHATKQLTVRAGLYNADPQDLGANAKHGVDFAFLPKNGVLTVAEIDYHWQQAPTAKGLPGKIIVGSFYDSSAQSTLADSTTQQRGNRQFYVSGQQMIYRPAEAVAAEGLTAWGVYSYSPSHSLSLYSHYAAAGLSYKGLIPSRPDDSSAIGSGKGWYSPAMKQHTYEAFVELSYVFMLNQSLVIQPDIQYVIRPGGRGQIANAWVIGVLTMWQF